MHALVKRITIQMYTTSGWSSVVLLDFLLVSLHKKQKKDGNNKQ